MRSLKRKPPVQPTLKPCISELLRTCLHPPSLLLRVERIVHETVVLPRDASTSTSELQQDSLSGYASRLFLTDGELTIQALVSRKVFAAQVSDHIHELDYLDIRRFEVNRANRRNGQGQVLYLGIEHFEVISVLGASFPDRAEDAMQKVSTKKRRLYDPANIKLDTEIPPSSQIHPPSPELLQAGSFTRDKDSAKPIIPPPTPIRPPSPHFGQESEDEDADFETLPIDLKAASERRQVLQELDTNADLRVSSAAKLSVTDPNPPHDIDSEIITDLRSTSATLPIPPRSPSPPQTTLNLSTLSSLLHPSRPLPKSHPTTLLAVISWTSTSVIHKPASPFPPKRHIKLHDPSTSTRYTGITLAVYVDAATFRPAVGTVALFRDVRVQTWEGEVILNAYAYLKDKGKEKWFVDDEVELSALGLGTEVAELKEWWRGRMNARKGPGNEKSLARTNG